MDSIKYLVPKHKMAIPFCASKILTGFHVSLMKAKNDKNHLVLLIIFRYLHRVKHVVNGYIDSR